MGFETTAPANAMTVKLAKQQGIDNFSLLVSHVLVPPAIRAIMDSPSARVQGFLAIDHAAGYDTARRRLGRWLKEGRIHTRYDIVDGFGRLPEALIGLFESDNFGKRLVRSGE